MLLEVLKYKKVPHLEGLSSNCSKLFRVVYKGLLAHAECDKDILKRADYQTFSVKYRGANFEMGNGIGPKK